MEGTRRERKGSAFFEAATGGNSSETRLTELDTHLVLLPTREWKLEDAPTRRMPMTEERSHRSSARKHGRDRSTRGKKRCETADAKWLRKNTISVYATAQGPCDATFFRFIDHDQRRSSSSSSSSSSSTSSSTLIIRSS